MLLYIKEKAGRVEFEIALKSYMYNVSLAA